MNFRQFSTAKQPHPTLFSTINQSFMTLFIAPAMKGIDGIWEGRAPSRPFYMAATERGSPNISIPFVAETIAP